MGRGKGGLVAGRLGERRGDREDGATAYLVTKKVMTQAENGGALVTFEDAALPFDVCLLDLTGACVELVNLGGAEALGRGEEDVHSGGGRGGAGVGRGTERLGRCGKREGKEKSGTNEGGL